MVWGFIIYRIIGSCQDVWAW